MTENILTRLEHLLIRGLRQRWERHFCKYDEDGESLCEECEYTYPECPLTYLLRAETCLEPHIMEEDEWQEPGTPRWEP